LAQNIYGSVTEIFDKMTSFGLKRVLGLPSITFIAIGFTIGGGVFIFTGMVYEDIIDKRGAWHV